jgi:hypothetical protein
MNNKTCGECRYYEHPAGQCSKVIEYNNCHITDKACEYFEPKNPTVFDRITASPEVLAENIVYTYEMAIGGSMFRVYWTSPLVENFYLDKSEAIAATVAKLKEVCDAESH